MSIHACDQLMHQVNTIEDDNPFIVLNRKIIQLTCAVSNSMRIVEDVKQENILLKAEIETLKQQRSSS